MNRTLKFIRRQWRRVGGWWDLKFGICPMCHSSPPDPDCDVCWGDRVYGHMASKEKREIWRTRFKLFV